AAARSAARAVPVSTRGRRAIGDSAACRSGWLRDDALGPRPPPTGRARAARHGGARAARRALLGLPQAVQGRPASGREGAVRDRPLCRGRVLLPALRRGGLPARPARVRHDLLLGLQPALRLLPEPRHLLAGAW